MTNPETIEIHGLNTIHKLCKFAADKGMDGSSFTVIVDRVFEELNDKTAIDQIFQKLEVECSKTIAVATDKPAKAIFFNLDLREIPPGKRESIKNMYCDGIKAIKEKLEIDVVMVVGAEADIKQSDTVKSPWVYVDTEGYPELSQQKEGENPSSREVFFELRHNNGTHHGWYIAIDGDQSDEDAENFEYKFNSNIGDELFDEDSVYRWMYVPDPDGQENK